MLASVQRRHGLAMVATQTRSVMPARSKAQQKAAGAALSAKRGETPKGKLRGASKDMAQSMSETELEKLAHTQRKGLPDHKRKRS